VRLDEHDPFAYVALTRGLLLQGEHEAAIALVMLGDMEEAVALSRKSQQQTNAAIFAHLAEISALGHLGRLEDAQDAIRRVQRAKADVSLTYVAKALPITDQACRDIFHQGACVKQAFPTPVGWNDA
jgi:Flp pilus assembly protein TadD